MNDIVWDGKSIKIGTKTICFNYEILEVRQSDDMVFVVTEPEGENIDNVFGIEVKNGKMWRIQSLKEIYPTIQPSPYVGVNISDGKVIVIDFCGCCFYISPKDGSIIGRVGFTK